MMPMQAGDVRATAAYTLGKVGDAQAVPALIDLINHYDGPRRGGARNSAVCALGEIGDARAVPGAIHRHAHPRERRQHQH